MDYNKLKQDIKDNIRPNGEGEITGSIMQDILVDMVEVLGEEQTQNTADAIEQASTELKELGAEKLAEAIEKTSEDLKEQTAQAIQSVTDSLPIEKGYSTDSVVQKVTNGGENLVTGNNASAFGVYNLVESSTAHAEGQQNVISTGAPSSHAEGINNRISGDSGSLAATHVEGRNNTVSTLVGHVEGYNNTASGHVPHVEGEGNTNTGDNSHVEGRGNSNSGHTAHVEGSFNTNTGNSGHIEGGVENYPNTNASITGHVEGFNNRGLSTEYGIHIEGGNNEVSGNSGKTHVEGAENKANNSQNSHVEGYRNTAENNNIMHIEGRENIGRGNACHIEGKGNTVSGANAHAGGEGNTVAATNAFAHGKGLLANSEELAAVGRYNTGGNSLFQVGCGTKDARKNAFDVINNGRIKVLYENTPTYLDTFVEDQARRVANEIIGNLTIKDDRIFLCTLYRRGSYIELNEGDFNNFINAVEEEKIIFANVYSQGNIECGPIPIAYSEGEDFPIIMFSIPQSINGYKEKKNVVYYGTAQEISDPDNPYYYQCTPSLPYEPYIAREVVEINGDPVKAEDELRTAVADGRPIIIKAKYLTTGKVFPIMCTYEVQGDGDPMSDAIWFTGQAPLLKPTEDATIYDQGFRNATFLCVLEQQALYAHIFMSEPLTMLEY